MSNSVMRRRWPCSSRHTSSSISCRPRYASPRPDEYSLRSAPAQKCGPAPRSTTQWTGLYSSASSSASWSSRNSFALSALRFSGRFNVTMAVLPFTS
jgi:hypothetical protein